MEYKPTEKRHKSWTGKVNCKCNSISRQNMKEEGLTLSYNHALQLPNIIYEIPVRLENS